MKCSARLVDVITTSSFVKNAACDGNTGMPSNKSAIVCQTVALARPQSSLFPHCQRWKCASNCVDTMGK
eukprot:1102561-Amphidinium_carterae.1